MADTQTYQAYSETLSALDALASVRAKIDAIGSTLESRVGPVASGISAYVGLASVLIGAVVTVIRAIGNGARTPAVSLIQVSAQACRGGVNACAVMANQEGNTGLVQQIFCELSSLFEDARSIQQWSMIPTGLGYQDYSSVFDEKASYSIFERLEPIASPVSMSITGISAIKSLASMDPVLSPPSTEQIGLLMAQAAAGFSGFSPKVLEYGVTNE